MEAGKINLLLFMMKKVLKNSLEMILVCDKALNIIYINPALKKRYPLLGKKFGLNKIFDKSDLDKIATSVSKGRPINIDGKSKEHFVNYLKFSITPFYGLDNKIYGCIITVNDSNFFREFTFDEEKTSIINAISQEMKHPLTMIFTCLDLIKKNLGKNINENIEKYISEINNNSYKLLRFSNHLIEIIELKENTGKLKYQECNICEQLNKTYNAFIKYLDSSKIKFTLIIPEKDILLYYDVEKVERVFLNIIVTAVKYLVNGGDIDVYLQDENDFIRVITKLKNIKNEDLLNNKNEFRILNFDEIYEKDKNVLGIYLAKSIVIKHGGTIHFHENTLNEMIIEFTLPKRKFDEISVHQFENYSHNDLLNQIDEEMSVLKE